MIYKISYGNRGIVCRTKFVKLSIFVFPETCFLKVYIFFKLRKIVAVRLTCFTLHLYFVFSILCFALSCTLFSHVYLLNLWYKFNFILCFLCSRNKAIRSNIYINILSFYMSQFSLSKPRT